MGFYLTEGVVAAVAAVVEGVAAVEGEGIVFSVMMTLMSLMPGVVRDV